MAREYGFIYILGNESMPGIYKIGFTANHPKARMEQLSGATACPTPFYLIACFGSAEARYLEGAIHNELSACRVNQSREFFHLTLAQVQDTVRRNCDPSADLLYTGSLDFDVYMDDIEREQEWKRCYFASQDCDPIHWRTLGGGGRF